MEQNHSSGWLQGFNTTTVALWGWTGAILIVGVMPLHNFVGHTHWELVQWTIHPRQWRSPKFYFDVIANIGLFYPLGLLLARQYAHRKPAVVLLGVGLLLSLGIEFFQLYCHNRHPSLIDLVSNSIGTALGVGTASAVFSIGLLRTWLPTTHSHPTGS